MEDRRKPFGEAILNDRDGKPIYPKTQGQYELIKAIDKYDILFVNGPAGTGKSFLTICKAVKDIDTNKYEKLILTRPVIESGEELGALPGTINDKIFPYMRPLYQCIEKLKSKKTTYNNGTSKKKKANVVTDEQQYIENWYKKIEISPLAYMRGITLENVFILLDEAQNVTIMQMKLFLTRLGNGSKVVIAGDATQSDLDRRIRSGFRHAQNLLKNVEGIGFITLNENDIVRHKLVKDIILKYEHDSFKNNVFSNQDYD